MGAFASHIIFGWEGKKKWYAVSLPEASGDF